MCVLFKCTTLKFGRCAMKGQEDSFFHPGFLFYKACYTALVEVHDTIVWFLAKRKKNVTPADTYVRTMNK